MVNSGGSTQCHTQDDGNEQETLRGYTAVKRYAHTYVAGEGLYHTVGTQLDTRPIRQSTSVCTCMYVRMPHRVAMTTPRLDPNSKVECRE